MRLLLSALTLLAVALWQKRSLDLRRDGVYYLIIGGLNAALPFGLFAWAAQHTTASMLSILNATTPIWGAVLTALWMRAPLTLKTMAGLVLGVAGVTVLVGFEGQAHGDMTTLGLLSVLAGLTAALCYGLAATYARTARPRHALDTAHGSAWGAMFWLLLALPFARPIEAVPEMRVVIAAYACLLVANRPDVPRSHFYDDLFSILVYPTPFIVPHTHRDGHGVVTEGHRVLSGQAWDSRRIIVSWQDMKDAVAQALTAARSETR